MQQLLITGWLGYIGSHAVVEFEKAGYETVIVDNLSNSKIEVLDNIEKILGYKPKFYKVDLLDKGWLEQVFKENKFDGVIHFAWLKVAPESINKPILYFQNNITGSINLFELMEKYWVKNIIFSSSANIYSFNEITDGRDLFFRKGEDIVLKRWIKETDPLWEPTNPYGRTKLLIEQILKDLARFADFKVISLRYFNPIGAHPSGLLGEDLKDVPDNLVPYIMKVLRGELDYLRVFGADYPTKDGTGVRDYIDIMDLVNGHLKAREYLKREAKKHDVFFKVYNLWVWRWVSVFEMIKLVEKVSWKKIPYKIVDRRPGDLAMSYCNADKAEKEFNWKAKVGLEESIKNMLKFYKV